MQADYLKKLFSLEGRKAIVTGGGQGIGRSIAMSLAAFGAEVTILGRNKETLERTVKEICQRGDRCQYYQLDLKDWESVDRFFDTYLEENERLDIYVSNAGATVRSALADTRQKDMDDLWNLNVKGALHGIQRSAELMKKQRSGNIVLITSVNALNAHPGQGMYSVTKYALEGAMKALASTLGPYGIRVNSCAPGAIRTAMNECVLADAAAEQKVKDSISLDRVGTPEEIGNVVACMVSDAFSYMTGATVVVDGGLLLRKG